MTDFKYSISVIIPVYNEQDTVLKIVEKVLIELNQYDAEIILIDSGSTDNSPKLIETLKHRAQISIFSLGENKGKGFAVKKGLQLASKDIIIIQDADLEYDPKDYHALLAPIGEQKSRLVLGSRHLGLNSWRIRTRDRFTIGLEVVNFGSEFLNALFCKLFGVSVSDSQTMFKVFHRRDLDTSQLKCRQFDLDWEILGSLVLKGHRPFEVPVQYRPRTFAEGKKIKIVRDGFQALYTILRVRFVQGLFSRNQFSRSAEKTV